MLERHSYSSKGQSTPQPGAYSSISAGKYFTCALGIKRATMSCWGDNTYGQCEPPLFDTCDNSELEIIFENLCALITSIACISLFKKDADRFLTRGSAAALGTAAL